MNSWMSRNLFLWPMTLAKGERVRKYLQQYRRAQWYEPEQLRRLQAQSLASMLTFAAQSSAFHRSRWSVPANVQGGDPVEMLRQIPCMTKADLAGSLDRIVTDRVRFATRKTTGGSTGQAVTLLKNPTALARERAATYRAYEWAGVEPGASQARFWGVPHSRQRRWFYAVADIVANRKRFSAFDFTEASLATYHRDIEAQRPKFLYGYVSMLRQFAAYLHDSGRRLPDSVVCAITTSEVLTDSIRAELRDRFGVPVYNEYGCGEVGSIAHECDHGSLHVMAENLILEIVDDAGRPAQSGELVVTDLHNIATPMIRYRLGDFATALDDRCPCGRGLPRLARIHGRAYDFIRDPGGRRFHPEAVIYVFETMKEDRVPIVQFQVEQVAIDRLLVRVVAGRGFDAGHAALIGTLLRRHVSAELAVDVTLVDHIPREKSGKLRLVKSSLPKPAE